MIAPARPRRTPCSSCPYRQGVPSGIWHPDEYAKLEQYDHPMHEQPLAVFSCHQGSGDVCAGWLGHADPTDLLAVRVGIIDGRVDAACAEYATTVPLFGSGAEAAAHGRKDIEEPTVSAVNTMRKILRTRARTRDASPIILDRENN